MKTETIEQFLKRGGEIKKLGHDESYIREFKYDWITKGAKKLKKKDSTNKKAPAKEG